METDGRCAGDGDAVQCVVLGRDEGILTLMQGTKVRGLPLVRGPEEWTCPAEGLLFTDHLPDVVFSI